MRYTVRPISDHTWLRSNSSRTASQFDATWSQTLQLLGSEIDKLGGRDIVIEVDVRERDIRLDGMLRADAKSASPAVVVAFETKKHGPMLYRADRYLDRWSNRPGWQENVRAVALTLQALRAVDRYGATETGQQYTGFKALPAGRAMPSSHMTSEQAYNVLYGVLDDDSLDQSFTEADLFRRARAVTHPDRNGGDRSLWDQVEQAARVLGVSA